MDVIEKLNQRKANKNAVILRQLARLIWVEKLFFYIVDLTEWQLPSFPKMRLNATFMIGDESDVVSLTSNPHLDAVNRAALYLEKFQAGHKLLLGKHNGEIVFYLWVVHDQKELMNKILPLQKNQVAVEKGFTRMEYRGHGFFVYGLNYLFPQLKSAGVTSCLTEIATHNSPMIRTNLKLGFKRTESYYYWINTPFKQYAVPVITSLDISGMPT